jgi:ferredoxin
MPTVSVKKINPDGTVTTENEIEITTEKGTAIWTAFEAQGHKLPAGCLKGMCAACRVQVLKGAENLEQPGPTEKETLELILKNKSPQELAGKTIRLACQAKISGDGAIEIASFN